VRAEVSQRQKGRAPEDVVIAAVYCRKSTEQRGIADEAKSIGRQIERGRAFAASKGWTVEDRFVFVDDAISGAEFTNRPGLQSLLAAAEPVAPFQRLIVMDPSRIGREMIEAAFVLKRLDRAGVAVWSYLNAAPIELDDPTKVLLMTIANFAADSERVSGRRRVLDTMRTKAAAGHVISTLPFGYSRLEVRAGDKRSHVAREIVPTAAAIVRRIFERYAAGDGQGRIAKDLTADGIPAPRGGVWTAVTIYGILKNEMYRGEIISHRYCYRDRWGQRQNTKRPPAEWIRVRSEADRIISDELWTAAAARRDGERAKITKRGDRPIRRTRDDASRYMLTNFAKCGACGGSMCVASRPPATGTTERQRFYTCLNYHVHGRARCANATTVDMGRMNAAILTAVRETIDGPRLIAKIVAAVLEKQAELEARSASPRLRASLARLEQEIGRLVDAIARGGLPSLHAALADREQKAAAVRAELAALERPKGARARLTIPAITKRVRAELETWQAALDPAASMEGVRRIFRELLDGPIVLEPAPGVVTPTVRARNQFGPRRDVRAFRFTGKLTLLPALAGVAGELPMFRESRTASGWTATSGRTS